MLAVIRNVEGTAVVPKKEGASIKIGDTMKAYLQWTAGALSVFAIILYANGFPGIDRWLDNASEAAGGFWGSIVGMLGAGWIAGLIFVGDIDSRSQSADRKRVGRAKRLRGELMELAFYARDTMHQSDHAFGADGEKSKSYIRWLKNLDPPPSTPTLDMTPADLYEIDGIYAEFLIRLGRDRDSIAVLIEKDGASLRRVKDINFRCEWILDTAFDALAALDQCIFGKEGGCSTRAEWIARLNVKGVIRPDGYEERRALYLGNKAVFLANKNKKTD